MDLPQRVADELKIDEAQAQQCLSSLFMSIRMAVDPKTFSQVTAAVPEANSWLSTIQLAGGRTGEVIALAGPEALMRQLASHGLSEPQARRLGATVGAALKELLPKEAFEKITGRVALLKQ